MNQSLSIFFYNSGISRELINQLCNFCIGIEFFSIISCTNTDTTSIICKLLLSNKSCHYIREQSNTWCLKHFLCHLIRVLISSQEQHISGLIVIVCTLLSISLFLKKYSLRHHQYFCIRKSLNNQLMQQRVVTT